MSFGNMLKGQVLLALLALHVASFSSAGQLFDFELPRLRPGELTLPLSVQTPLALESSLLQYYELADEVVAQWVTEYIRARAANVDGLLVLVGNDSKCVTTYLPLHQKGHIDILILGRRDYVVLEKYLSGDPDLVDEELLLSVRGIQAQLDRLAHQFATYRSYSKISRRVGLAFCAVGTMVLLGCLQSTLEAFPREKGGLASLFMYAGMILSNRWWSDADDAAVSDNPEVLEGFKAQLEALKEDAYSNKFIRFWLSDWHTPSPESRLANIQKRLDRLR